MKSSERVSRSSRLDTSAHSVFELVAGRLLDDRDTRGVGAGRGRQRVVRSTVLAEQGPYRKPNPGRADPPIATRTGPPHRLGNRGGRSRRESQRAGESHRRRRLRQLRSESGRRPRTRRERHRRSGDADQIDSAGRAAREQVSGARSPDDRRAAQGRFDDRTTAPDVSPGWLRAARDAAGLCGDLRRAVVRHRESHTGAGDPRSARCLAMGSRAHGDPRPGRCR